jgi:hypothetical protein
LSILVSAPHHHSHAHQSHPHIDEEKQDIKQAAPLRAQGDSDVHSLLAKIDRLIGFLSVYFGDVKLLEADNDHSYPRAKVHLDDACAEISLDDFVSTSVPLLPHFFVSPLDVYYS